MAKFYKAQTPKVFLKTLKRVHSFLFFLTVAFFLFSIWAMQLIFEVLTIENDIILISVAVLLTICLVVEKALFNLRLKRGWKDHSLKSKVLKYYKITADRYLIISLIICFSIMISFVVNVSIYLSFSILLLIYYYKLRVSEQKAVSDLNLQREFLDQFNKFDEELPENI
ncbi:hypothetical protein [uncultured Kordia sp.]|uniref:hypothetical protein n=1 Tax=uncultured Kordia sp. TaxID=507699 RepID=UPI002607F57E|nr:hypothetical protein [uncultured Kordia sp.]